MTGSAARIGRRRASRSVVAAAAAAAAAGGRASGGGAGGGGAGAGGGGGGAAACLSRTAARDLVLASSLAGLLPRGALGPHQRAGGRVLPLHLLHHLVEAVLRWLDEVELPARLGRGRMVRGSCVGRAAAVGGRLGRAGRDFGSASSAGFGSSSGSLQLSGPRDLKAGADDWDVQPHAWLAWLEARLRGRARHRSGVSRGRRQGHVFSVQFACVRLACGRSSDRALSACRGGKQRTTLPRPGTNEVTYLTYLLNERTRTQGAGT